MNFMFAQILLEGVVGVISDVNSRKAFLLAIFNSPLNLELPRSKQVAF